MSVLELKGVTIKFGGLTAAQDISFSAESHKIMSVIGPNGAGKTTVFNAITGVYPPNAGLITLDGKELREPLRPQIIVYAILMGIATGLLAVLAVNCATLWQAAIVDRYLYGEPFDWTGAIETASSTLLQLPLSRTLLTFLGFGGVGAAAFFSLWHRSRRSPLVASRRSVARTFQNIRLFENLSVLENVLVGMHGDYRSSWIEVVLGLPRYRREQKAGRKEAIDLLDFVGLGDRSHLVADQLSYGDLRRLEIARALATKPLVLLLDEPAAGMNPSEMKDLMELIRGIRGRGITVLLIEHHMQVVMNVSHRVAVLEYGRMIAHGTPEEVKHDPRVIAAYLGEDHD